MTIRKGFTLIELLVVIAIIGILSTLAVVALNNARIKSRDAKRVSDIKQIQTALEMYYNENSNSYPSSGSGSYNLGTTGRTALCGGASNLGFVTSCGASDPVYMGQVPKDPSSGNYVYTLGTGNYTLTTVLEGNTGSFVAGTVTADANGMHQ